ncbi:ornithine--oxo-acid transaminase [Desulfobacula phenolica]|uniref:ornithine aminotransferase n=1 Tax=Desulfobacula phenolica TaxID=90732 RepID=A0A1H2HU88_9BACT|nr:ornithine--oxo-acid transaminase [Desulfobacula phenolica]SDU35088.1 ornithine--oxo-acid transaminase [Desulfobacula phenolica]
MDYLEIERKLGAKNYKPLDVVLNRGEGIWVWDVDGNRYMDCLSAYSAVNQGHCHPEIVKALTDQAGKLSLTSRAFRNDQLGLFYKTVCELTNSHKVLPMNSGAEAVETAIKTVRKWGYKIKGIAENKAQIIVCDNNFHGRTITIISFSSDPCARDGFGPFTPGFKSIPFGDATALKNAINENTIAFMVEPIQGEAGVIIPPKGYLKDVRQICDDNNIVLILDEIQTGLGRTGKLLAEEHEGIEADMTLIGKALSGGLYPVSAVLSNTQIMDVLNPGEHGSTFGGNPLACAVAVAALKVLIKENMIENSAVMGDYFLSGLKMLKNPLIKEVRGRGLMIGLEFIPDKINARNYCESLKDNGILCKETHGNIIRFAPPLVVKKEDIDHALNIIHKVIG